MDISPRLKQILISLLEEQNVISIQQLSEIVGISKRTIQREMSGVNQILAPYHISFISKTGKGVWLEGEEIQRKQLYDSLKEVRHLDMNDKNQRRKRLIFELLKQKESRKLFYYADLFGVSETTISNDMEVIEEWFSWMDLKIIRKQGVGVSLEGSEKGYRLAIRRFLTENIQREEIRNLLNYGSKGIEETSIEEKEYYQLISFDVFDQVIVCLNSMSKTKISRMEESSYLGLALHLTITIIRLQQGKYLEQEEFDYERGEEWILVCDLIERLNALFSIRMSKEEVDSIYLQIKGARIQYAQVQEELNEGNKEEVTNIIRKLLQCFDTEKAYELQQDEELIHGLSIDIQAMLIRMTNNITIYNPLLKQIKDSDPHTFECVKRAIRFIEKEKRIVISEEEIAYLAVHFSAALLRLESKKQNLRKVKIGIICASGIGISKLMESKLKQRFHGEVELYSYAFEDINGFIEGTLDFFVSSLPIPNHILQIEIVLVNPLLSEEDMKKIESMVLKYAHLPVKKEKENVEFTKKLEKISFMASQIKTILSNCSLIQMKENSTLEEVIKIMAKKVARYPEYEHYIERDIHKREKIATQMIEEMGFALFHARTNGVLEPRLLFGVTTSRTPFIDPSMKKMKGIVMMLIPNDIYVQQNAELLGVISSSLIENEDFLTTIFHGEEHEIQEYVTKKLKQYFKQYLEKIG